MSRFRKLYKKYERHFLLGIVIILLASFSITGAFSCQDRGQGRSYNMGGEFTVAPGEREEIDDPDFDRMFAKYFNFQNAIRMASREFRMFIAGLRPPEHFKAAWAHTVLLAAAKRAGYTAGDHQVRTAVQDMVGFALLYRARMPWSEPNYQQFLRQNYSRGTQAEFQEAVREVVIKDQFLYPIVTSSRYQVPYADAYKAWRATRERVDLRYVALPAAPFAADIRKEEDTRAVIGTQAAMFTQVTNTAAMIRRIQAKIDAHKRAKGALPASLDELAAAGATYKVSDDEWEMAPRYTAGTGDIRSAGPDKTFDTPDDVTVETQKQLDTHGTLHELAEKIGQRRTATSKWPATLEELKSTGTGGNRLPGLVRNVNDGWGKPFEYEAGSAGTPPTLTSLGPDGALGTADDIKLTLDPDSVRVTPGPALAVYVAADLEDSWARPLSIRLSRAQPPTWQVSSAGLDGEAGNEDDLVTGNAQELKLFFNSVRGDYNLPARRRFETLFVHLPLVSDAALKRLWAKYPQHRPTDEEQVFTHWRSYRGDIFYGAEDPADPEKGHGAELAKRVAPDAKLTLVPAADVFPDPLVGKAKDDAKKDDAKKDDAKKDADDDGEDGEDGEDGGDDEAKSAEDERKAAAEAKEAEERKTFREKGWRQIVIREFFLENLLNDLLQRCRTNRLDMLKAEGNLAGWNALQEKHKELLAAWQKSEGAKPEADRAPKPVAPKAEEPKLPEAITFESLLAGELADLVGSGDAKTPAALQYWKTPELMSREDWEKNENFGDGLQFELSRLKQDGEYNGIPTQLHRRLTKVLVRRLEFKPQQPQSYDDVKDKVFDRFIEKRQMDRAVDELKKLQLDVDKAIADLGNEPTDAAKQAAWDGALKTWSDRVGGHHLVETTGLFIGNTPPPPFEIEDGTAEAEKARMERLNFMWRTGYSTVRPVVSRQDTVTAEPGSFGRRVLRDPKEKDRGSGYAYLVRVADRVWPSKAEFSPRRYTQYLSTAVFGDRARVRSAQRLRDREGKFNQALARYFDDMDWLQVTFDLQTNSELDSLDERKKR